MFETKTPTMGQPGARGEAAAIEFSGGVEAAPSFDSVRALELSRALTSALPEATVLIIDSDETVLIAEGDLLERNGRRPGGLSGNKLVDILPAATSRMLRAHYRAALAGKPSSFDYRTVDGIARCRVQVTPMYFGHQRAVAVVAVLQDVTERREVAEDLRLERRRRESAEEIAGVGYLEIDLASASVSISDGAARLLGLEAATTLSLASVTELMASDADRERLAQVLSTPVSDTATECEVDVRRASGSHRHLLLRCMQHANDDRKELVVGTIVDLTAVKQREAELLQNAAELKQLNAIRFALGHDRMVLHAQPIVDLQSGAVVQQELLIRMNGEDGQLVPPADFLPLAERHGAITEVDHWVVGRALEFAAAGIAVAVNLSAASVGDQSLLTSIRDGLMRSGADPSLIVFEVTETALMADLGRGKCFAQALRNLGCRFALDDFGTGYGTFTYLKHIPIDVVKIDIEFVRDLINDPQDERLIRAIVAIARELGKKTTAEGVEDIATLQRLRELGVDQAQGYHLGRPVEIPRPTCPELGSWRP